VSRGRVAIVVAVVAAVGLGVTPRAAAEPSGDAVALLPLDADRSLEIYGQPVASEIARALVAGNVAVVVVGPRMAVPERARLIIDGTIALGKASAVTIALRVRDTLDGHVLDTLSATAPGLAKIDGAAAELSSRVLPLVRDRLAALRRPDDHEHGKVHVGEPPRPAAPDRVDRPLRFTIGDVRGPDSALHGALAAELGPWAHAHHRAAQPADAGKPDARRAPAADDLAVAFWILAYTPEAGAVPMARARVRVQVSDARAVVFDRVVVTDTVLGEKGLAPGPLAARVAREILAILRPHLARSVPSWD